MLKFEPHNHTYTLDGIQIPSVTEICRFLSVDFKSDKPWLAKIAADRGTRVHAACAAIDWGEEPEITPDIAGYVTAYRRFLNDYRPDWEGIEYTGADTSLEIAGTIDRFGTLYDGRTCILDIKTGARLHDASLRAQLTGYECILDFSDVFYPEVLYALQLAKDGTYVLREVNEDMNLLDACIFIHNAVERKKSK